MDVYRVLAYLVGAGVASQAAVLAWGVFALSSWAQEGGVLDQAASLRVTRTLRGRVEPEPVELPAPAG